MRYPSLEPIYKEEERWERGGGEVGARENSKMPPQATCNTLSYTDFMTHKMATSHQGRKAKDP